MAEGDDTSTTLHIECSICLDYVNPDADKLVSLKTCGHVFHDRCIRTWFSNTSYDSHYPAANKCPLCNAKCSQADIQPLFIQTKKAEPSDDETAKELQRVRELLKKERENADKASSALIDPVVEMVGRMRLHEQATSQRAVFMPNGRHVLFEGCTGLEDSVALREYRGARNWHHQRQQCWRAELIPAPSLGRDTIHNSLMQAIFSQQLAVLKATYDENKDGRLELTVKFGSVYVIRAPVTATSGVRGFGMHAQPSSAANQMLVRDFNYGVGIQHKKHDPSAVGTSFAPVETPAERIVAKLQEAGFRETGQEDVVVVNVDHSKQRPRIVFEVILSGRDLRFRSLRQNDRSFMTLDVVRRRGGGGGGGAGRANESGGNRGVSGGVAGRANQSGAFGGVSGSGANGDGAYGGVSGAWDDAATLPDIRLAVKSVDEEFSRDKLQVPALSYARDNLVRRDPHNPQRLLADRSVAGKVSYVRHKRSRIFQLLPSFPSSSSASSSPASLEQYLEVKLLDTTSYEEPQSNGTFRRTKQQTEVYVKITGRERLYAACDQPDFLHKLLHFCNKFT